MRFHVKETLVGADAVADPYPAYARLREQGPVRRIFLRAGLPCWVVTRYAEARKALADPRLSRDPRCARPEWNRADRGRPLEDTSDLGVHMLTTEPPDHTRLRRLVSSHFSVRRAADLRPRLEEVANALIDRFAGHGEADLIADYAYPMSITVICEILGIPEDDFAIFRQWTSNAVRPGPEDVPDPGRYLGKLVAAKRRAPADDLIGHLITAADRGEITEVELKSMIFRLLLAGHEGSVALIGNGVLALLAHEGRRELLCADPRLLRSAVEEILRHDGPMELAAWRFATEPVELGGALIEPGDPVVIALAAAHRDPARFTEPDRWDITRPDLAHLGFGHGVHHCLGAPLARAEGAVALEAVFRRLPDLALARDAESLPWQPSEIIRGLHELPVRFTPTTAPRVVP